MFSFEYIPIVTKPYNFKTKLSTLNEKPVNDIHPSLTPILKKQVEVLKEIIAQSNP